MGMVIECAIDGLVGWAKLDGFIWNRWCGVAYLLYHTYIYTLALRGVEWNCSHLELILPFPEMKVAYFECVIPSHLTWLTASKYLERYESAVEK